jgi:hypothetical protein
MNWKNARIDKPPQHGQTILISADGVYYIAVYDAEYSVYRLTEEPGTCFDNENNQIYWMEFTTPN